MIAAKPIGKKRYAIRMGSRKTITVLMPLKADNLRPIAFEVACDHRSFALSGERLLVPDPALGVYVCRFRATTSQSECSGTLIARAGGEECRAEIRSLDELGSSITIKIEDISHGNQRYAWRRNVLEIAARPPFATSLLRQ